MYGKENTKMDNGIFMIIYNDGRGEMTLYLDKFFERNLNSKAKKFYNTIKPDIYKIFALVNENCSTEDILSLLDWLKNHHCEDLVEYYKQKYQWIKEYL